MITKREDGWLVETTNRRGGALEQGGVCGRVVLVSREQLVSAGVDPDADPGSDWSDFVSVGEFVREHLASDGTVLDGGERVR